MPTRDRFSLLLVQISATLFPETERQSTPLPHTFLKMPQRAKIEHKLKDAVWRQFNFNLVILIPGAEHERINASLVWGGEWVPPSPGPLNSGGADDKFKSKPCRAGVSITVTICPAQSMAELESLPLPPPLPSWVVFATEAPSHLGSVPV